MTSFKELFAISLISSTLKFIMTKTLKNLHNGENVIKIEIKKVNLCLKSKHHSHKSQQEIIDLITFSKNGSLTFCLDFAPIFPQSDISRCETKNKDKRTQRCDCTAVIHIIAVFTLQSIKRSSSQKAQKGPQGKHYFHLLYPHKKVIKRRLKPNTFPIHSVLSQSCFKVEFPLISGQRTLKLIPLETPLSGR